MTTKILQSNMEGYIEGGRLIRQGELVAFPTETVYGLGANALDTSAVSKIYVAKGRPSDNPLIVHISNKEQLNDIVSYISETAHKIIDNLMPGSITIVLPKSDNVDNIITAGLDTVAVRMPESIEARQFIEQCQVPIAAPSANTSSRPSPTSWQDVAEDMNGRISAIIAGADCKVGIESTVLDLTQDIPTILRPGIVTASTIASVLSQPVKVVTDITDKVNSPGVRYKHYAPKCPMVLNIDGDIDKVKSYYNSLATTNRVVILTNEDISGMECYLWGNSEEEIASNIYKALRYCEKHYDYIIAMYSYKTELSDSVLNRLTKSSSGHII